jgi:hypothetical protein
MAEENKDQANVDGHEKNEGKQDQGNKDQQANMIPKARLDQEIQKRKASEDALKEVADSLRESIPEEHRDLIPDLPPAKLVKWIQQANAKGLFAEKKVEALDTKRAGDKHPQDLSGLSPQKMMSMGYTKK